MDYRPGRPQPLEPVGDPRPPGEASSIGRGPLGGSTTHGGFAQRVALAASVWVGASLALALMTFWWQAGQVGGITRFNLLLLLPALGFATISFGLRTLRWHFFLVAAGAALPLAGSLRTQLMGLSLTMTPGKVGEVYKCYLVDQRTGVPTVRTAPIVLFEKIMDALAFSGLAVVSAALLPSVADSVSLAARSLILAGLAGLALIAALRTVRPEVVAQALLRVVGRHRVGRKLTSGVVLALSGGADLLNGPVLARNMLMSLAARTCDGLSLAWAAWALGVDLPVLGGILALNSSGALGGLSMLPGGIGVVEVSMSMLLVGFGAPAPTALVATLAARLFTLWLWVAIGLYLLVRGAGSGDRG